MEFSAPCKASARDLEAWEKKNLPYKLPDDVRAFYQLFDGFKLDYTAEAGTAKVPVGTLCLNNLDDLVRVPIVGVFPGHSSTAGMSSAGFALDSRSSAGNTVMLFHSEADRQLARGSVNGSSSSGLSSGSGSPVDPTAQSHASYESPEVWFQDRSSRWHFLSSTFSDYLRLMVVHAGVHNWQLAFTPEGLPPLSQQWMNLFSRERLTMDLVIKNR